MWYQLGVKIVNMYDTQVAHEYIQRMKHLRATLFPSEDGDEEEEERGGERGMKEGLRIGK